MWIQSMCLSLHNIYILYFECIKTTNGKKKHKKEKNKKMDADTICDNTLITVTQKEYAPHFILCQ